MNRQIIFTRMRRLRPPGIEMNLQIRPKLYPPLALLAALPAPARHSRLEPLTAARPNELRRLVATMID
jgi:hypothetical protein